jgi:hypothetical protein
MVYDLLVIAGYAVVQAIAASVFFRLTSTGRLMDSAWIRDRVAFLTLVLPTILYFTFKVQSRPRDLSSFGFLPFQARDPER